MRPKPWRLALLCAISVCAVPAVAKRKKTHAPLPQKIVQAKTVYLDNRSGLAYIGDNANDELLKWGRLQVVGSPKEADLVFLLSAHEYVSHYVTSGTVEAEGTTYDYGDGISSTRVSGQTESTTTPVMTGRTYLTVIDPGNGAPLWSDSMEWGRPIAFVPYSAWRSASRGLIKELREQVEDQGAEAAPSQTSQTVPPSAPAPQGLRPPEDPPTGNSVQTIRPLPQEASSVSIVSDPAGADITIDGKFVGNTPSNVRLAPGDHAVAVEKAGFARWQRILTVNAGESLRIDAALERVSR